MTEQTVQHLSHLYGLTTKGIEISGRDGPGISRDDQVILQLRGRVQREANKARELLRAFLAVALYDVGRDRKRRSNHLTAQ